MQQEEWSEMIEGSPLVIASMYNEEYELWEVSLNGMLLGNFIEEDEAANLAANIHFAFEHGYVNGIQQALDDPAQAQRALVARGLAAWI